MIEELSFYIFRPYDYNFLDVNSINKGPTNKKDTPSSKLTSRESHYSLPIQEMGILSVTSNIICIWIPINWLN